MTAVLPSATAASDDIGDTPRASLSVFDGVMIMVGIVIGIGIFKTPSLVAANVQGELAFIGVWLIGGAVTLLGALVYAELSSAHPSTGGEYHFLTRGLGRPIGLLFCWARVSVIQTGAIAAVAFVFGDYAQQLVPLGRFGPSIYAGLVLVALTVVNVIGTYQSKTTQVAFTLLTLVAMAVIVIAALTVPAAAPPPTPSASGPEIGAAGLAMVFVLLTYGGWNEAAYISAEIRDPRRNMLRVLLIGTAVVVVLYVLVNSAYLNILGLETLRRSDAAAADAMRLLLGDAGAVVLSLAVCFAALSTLNATIFTGARAYHALGTDLPALHALGLWDRIGNNPKNAIILQSVVAMALVLFGALSRDGFQAMVEYTAPVFWFFLLLVGISSFVLRHSTPARSGAFRVPLYPITPALFCLTCGYLLYSSIAYTGLGALFGIAVLLLGIPLLLLAGAARPLNP